MSEKMYREMLHQGVISRMAYNRLTETEPSTEPEIMSHDELDSIGLKVEKLAQHAPHSKEFERLAKELETEGQKRDKQDAKVRAVDKAERKAQSKATVREAGAFPDYTDDELGNLMIKLMENYDANISRISMIDKELERRGVK